MSAWTTAAAVDVKSQLFRALAVLRVILLVNAVALNLYRIDNFTSHARCLRVHRGDGRVDRGGALGVRRAASPGPHAARGRPARDDGPARDHARGEGRRVQRQRAGLLDHGGALRLGHPLPPRRRTGGRGPAGRRRPGGASGDHPDRLRQRLPAGHRRPRRRLHVRVAAAHGDRARARRADRRRRRRAHPAGAGGPRRRAPGAGAGAASRQRARPGRTRAGPARR